MTKSNGGRARSRTRSRPNGHDTGSFMPSKGRCRAANKARHTRKDAKLLARRTGAEAFRCEYCDDYHVGRRRAEKWAPGGVEHCLVEAIIARGGRVVRTHLVDVAAAVIGGGQSVAHRQVGNVLHWLTARDLVQLGPIVVTADPDELRAFLADITAPFERE